MSRLRENKDSSAAEDSWFITAVVFLRKELSWGLLDDVQIVCSLN